jgi:tetratricopeptide (TPR) repeat protein
VGPSGLIVAACAFAAPSVLAQAPQQREICYRTSAADDQTIGGCTAVIQSGKESQDNQAIAYYNRGIGYQNRKDYELALKDYELALKDYDQALRLRPNHAEMLDSRAFTELKLNLYDAAITDYNDVLKLKPNKEESLYGRGLAKRASGDKAGGDADIEAALKIRSDVPKDFEKWGVSP